jgi:SAM-dependent methyltransferase
VLVVSCDRFDGTGAKGSCVRLSVVIPFRNELGALPTMTRRLLDLDLAALGVETELIFVDDGSTGADPRLLDPRPRDDLRLLVHERGRGRGAAVQTGLEAATGDVLCIQHADLGYDPADLPALVQPILDGEFEVVYGSRFKGSAAGLSYTHRVANRLLNVTVNVLFNRYLSDVYTGCKVFTRRALEGLTLTAKTAAVEMELTAQFLRKGLVIYEVPISYRAGAHSQGRQPHLSHGLRAAGAALRYRFRSAPRAVGPLSPHAPDARGALDAAEGSIGSIHTLGLEDLGAAVHYRRYHLELIEPHLGDSVLEVGAGLGDFAAQLTGRKRLVVADSDPYCLWSLRARLGSRPEVEVRALDLLGEVKLDPPVDSVVAINVLEHLEDDVRALKTMASTVVPGGNVVLLVPGYPSLYGEFDRAVGHVRRYTPTTLRQAVEAAGLQVTRLRPVNLLGGMAWWVAVRMGGRARPTPTLVKLYDWTIVPLTRAFERRFDPPFGQSVICVARVPEP